MEEGKKFEGGRKGKEAKGRREGREEKKGFCSDPSSS